MTTIWKYALATVDTQAVVMPSDAKLLDVQVQDDVLCLWVQCDPQYARCKRVIHIVGTGNPTLGGNYVGSVQMPPFVWHIFDGGEADA